MCVWRTGQLPWVGVIRTKLPLRTDALSATTPPSPRGVLLWLVTVSVTVTRLAAAIRVGAAAVTTSPRQIERQAGYQGWLRFHLPAGPVISFGGPAGVLPGGNGCQAGG